MAQRQSCRFETGIDIPDYWLDFNSENVSLTLVGVRKRRLSARKRWYRHWKVELPRDISGLELCLLAFEQPSFGNNKIDGPLIYIESSPLHLSLMKFRDTQVVFHSSNGFHYGVLEPKSCDAEVFSDGSEVIKQRMLLPGMVKGTPFFQNLVDRHELYTGVDNWNEFANASFGTISNEVYREYVKAFLNGSASFYSRVFGLFNSEDIGAYMEVRKKHLKAEHRQLPVFSYANYNGKTRVEKVFQSQLKKFGTYLLGSEDFLRSQLDGGDLDKMRRIYLSCTIGAAAGVFLELITSLHINASLLWAYSPWLADALFRGRGIIWKNPEYYSGILGALYQNTVKPAVRLIKGC